MMATNIVAPLCICTHVQKSHIGMEGMCTECQCFGFKKAAPKKFSNSIDDAHVQELQRNSGVNND